MRRCTLSHKRCGISGDPDTTWNLEMALEVLTSQNVDGDTWSDAVKWLLIYGPPGVREVIQQASTFAFSEYFPGLEAKGYTEEGHPYYDLNDLAGILDVPPEEVAGRLAEIQFEENVEIVVEGDQVRKVH